MIMKTCFNCVTALLVFLLGSLGLASETRVIINLSDQRASLIQQGRVTLVSPIASGKPGLIKRDRIQPGPSSSTAFVGDHAAIDVDSSFQDYLVTQ
jgi:hypothetical protein